MSVIGLRIKVNVVVPDDSQLLLTKAVFGCCRMANKKKLIRELLKDMILCETPLKWIFCKVDIIQNPITEFQCLIFNFFTGYFLKNNLATTLLGLFFDVANQLVCLYNLES